MTLRRKFTLGLYFLILLPLGGAILVVHLSLRHHLEHATGFELQDRVKHTADTLNAFFHQRQSELRIFASSRTLIQGTATEVTSRLEQLSLLSFYFDGLYLVDSSGRIAAATDAAAAGRALAEVFPELRPHAARLANSPGRQVLVSDFADLPPAVLARAPAGGLTARDLRLQLLTSVLDESGRPSGLLVGVLSPAAAAQMIAELNERTVDGGAAFLLAPDGRVLLTLDRKSRVLQPHGDWPVFAAAVRAAPDRSGFVHITDHHGDEILAGFAVTDKLDEQAGGWIVISTAPYAAVMAPALAVIARLGWLLLGLMILAMLAALTVAHRFVRPLETVTAGVRRLATGDLSARVPVVGRDELAELASTFNSMAGALQFTDAALKGELAERQRTEVALAQARDAAEAANRAKSEFLATMSHEIRTPMNGVIGTIGLLLESELTPRQRELAAISRNSADALLAVINDILDFSKIEAGRMELEPVPFDLLHALEEVGEMFAPRIEEKNLELILRFAPGTPRRLIGDAGRLRQVVANLLSNAVKFTTRGHILISVECSADPAANGYSAFRVLVEDTGIGLEPEGVARLFQRFSQADASTTRRFGGTGLGLAICKHLVERMGGEIGVNSRPGKGTSFWFDLRLPLDPHPPTPPPETRGIAGLRALIVDDNAVNRRVLHEQVVSWRMRNGSSASGAEALVVLRAAAGGGDPYQIALLDYHMPDMDGVALARAIRADPQLSGLVLILLTSFIERDTAALERAGGFAACLVKPVRPSALFDVLATAWAAKIGVAAWTERPRVALASVRPEFSARILVADDNTTNQKVAQLALESYGCRVDLAANGAEVIALLHRLPYDLVFMDCEMPELDGFEATRRIRSEEAGFAGGKDVPEPTSTFARFAAAGVRIPVIAMTAKALAGDREKCLAAGMDDYLSKPLALDALQRTLAKWLPAPGVGDPGNLPAGARATAIPTLDGATIERWKSLARDLGSNLFIEVLGIFRTEAPLQARKIRAHVEAGDAPALRHAAHSLRGASLNLGAQGLAGWAARLEQLGADGTVAGAAEQLADGEAELARVLAAVDHELAKP